MKLATAALALSVSLFGCATDNDGEGGASQEGLRPAKPSIDDVRASGSLGINPAINFIIRGGLSMDIEKGGAVLTPDGGEVSAEHINVGFPIENLCVHCDDVLVLREARDPNDLHVIDSNGQFLCHIWTAPDGHIVSSNCGR